MITGNRSSGRSPCGARQSGSQSVRPSVSAAASAWFVTEAGALTRTRGVRGMNERLGFDVRGEKVELGFRDRPFGTLFLPRAQVSRLTEVSGIILLAVAGDALFCSSQNACCVRTQLGETRGREGVW